MNKKIAHYIRIAEDIHNKILNGFYYEGTPLPSQRLLAEKYRVSRFTISQAIEILYSNGFLKSSGGKKSIVTKIDRSFPDWQTLVEQSTVPGKAWRARKKQNVRALWPTRVPGIASDFEAQELILPALERAGKRLFEPENYEKLYSCGLPGLNRAYRSYLNKRGINAGCDEILITSGVESAVSIIAHSLCSPKLNLFLATPSVYSNVPVFKNTGINIIEIPMDKEGIIPGELLKHSKHFNNSILYIEPTAVEPVGVCTSQRRRMELLKILQKTTMPIIENDHRHELWSGAASCKTFKELLPEKVIYIDGSFKVFFPNTQVACVIASEFLISRFNDIKVHQYYYTSSINQLLAEELLLSGDLDNFFIKTRTELERRKEQTDALLHKYLGDEAEWEKPVAGLYFWLHFKNVNTHHLCMRFVNNEEFGPRIISSILYMNGDIRHLQFCYANVSMDQVEKSIQMIADEVARCR